MIKSVFNIVLCLNSITCYNIRKPFVVEGEFTEITLFPYSAHLGVSAIASKNGTKLRWTCGSSVLNQRILLTAAHCLYTCDGSANITVMYGHANKEKMNKTAALRYILHADFSEKKMGLNDIGLVMTKKNLELASNVARVAILKNPPYNEMGYVAGWGFVDEIRKIPTNLLKYTTQRIMNQADCQKVLGRLLPVGVICGGTRNAKSYASLGDSGSALVVRGYIQVGIVSCKWPNITRSITLYTDVGHFYEWIFKNSHSLYCY